jgi:glyoxylase-like metal-dependent hydrolase (beta-lactamase superfamily II)
MVLVPMPGHTPGSTVARVGLDRDGTFVLASDAAPLQSAIDSGIPPKNTWDMNLAAAALVELKKWRDAGETVVSGHDDEQWKHLRKATEFYE